MVLVLGVPRTGGTRSVSVAWVAYFHEASSIVASTPGRRGFGNPRQRSGTGPQSGPRWSRRSASAVGPSGNVPEVVADRHLAGHRARADPGLVTALIVTPVRRAVRRPAHGPHRPTEGVLEMDLRSYRFSLRTACGRTPSVDEGRFLSLDVAELTRPQAEVPVTGAKRRCLVALPDPGQRSSPARGQISSRACGIVDVDRSSSGPRS